ncbi:baseplate assembly protein [Scytonema sp. UIC 10036]|uniref:phage baseplate assembly protein V n=1 Tax=Scytonema sp. UIC 10036 TaxID=2304196 RepID=UPI0012DA8B7D|nr:phage baseplate assembly protein V [Scytonema sp. UIC 10036]MUG92577.1 baseplate assembly protein [Scytonema sp. UIC 10036]
MNIQEHSGCGSTNKQSSPFYGKYRGVVSDNKDPWKIGRLRAKVEDVYGDRESGWALPSVPYAGKGVGLFLIPPVGALVWIEFENGDPDYPIWTGCFWADDKVGAGILPATPASPEIKVLKTDIGTIEINDTRGQESITIAAKIGGQTMQLAINASEIKIINGLASDVGAAAIRLKNTPAIEISTGRGASVNLDGMKVSINGNALEVM